MPPLILILLYWFCKNCFQWIASSEYVLFFALAVGAGQDDSNTNSPWLEVVQTMPSSRLIFDWHFVETSDHKNYHLLYPSHRNSETVAYNFIGRRRLFDAYLRHNEFCLTQIVPLISRVGPVRFQTIKIRCCDFIIWCCWCFVLTDAFLSHNCCCLSCKKKMLLWLLCCSLTLGIRRVLELPHPKVSVCLLLLQGCTVLVDLNCSGDAGLLEIAVVLL